MWTFPLLLGHGKRLFAGMARPSLLRLESTEVSSTGVVISVYSVGGEEVTTGTIPIIPVADPDPELRET